MTTACCQHVELSPRRGARRHLHVYGEPAGASPLHAGVVADLLHAAANRALLDKHPHHTKTRTRMTSESVSSHTQGVSSLTKGISRQRKVRRSI